MPETTTTRTRDLPDQGQLVSGVYTEKISWQTEPVTSDRRDHVVPGKQVTVSEGHPWPPKGSTKEDLGGPFYTTKSYAMPGSSRHIDLSYVDGYWTYRYKGDVAVINAAGKFPPSAASSDAQLNVLGATAISRCAPGNPPADAATFLGELVKEGLPSMIGAQMWKDRTSSAKSKSSDEYLNVQFGWMPIYKEMQKFASSIAKADSYMNQLRRDSGRVVRRTYGFPRERSVEDEVVIATNASVFGPQVSNFNFPPYGTIRRRRETDVRRWFSGSFTYYIDPELDSRAVWRRRAAEVQQLLGASPNPETLWNIAPWSWAIDWFSNTGDVISNLSRFGSGGLIMQYGYMMETSIVKDTYTIDYPGLRDPNVNVPPLVLVTETKQRVKANPFGFGVTWNGLSAFQSSILAALGVSKFGR